MSASLPVAGAVGALGLLVAIVALLTFGQACILQSDGTRQDGAGQGAMRRIAVLSLILAVLSAAVSAASLASFIPVVRAIIDAGGTRTWEPSFWVFLLVYILIAPLCIWQVTVADAAVRRPRALVAAPVRRRPAPVAAATRRPSASSAGQVRNPERFLSRQIERRWIRFFGGVFILAAPAYYAFAPPQPGPVSRLGYVRAVIMVMWLFFVVVGVLGTGRHERAVDDLAAEARHMRSESREEAGSDILRRLVPPRDAPASEYEWALYVPLSGGQLIGPMPEVSPPSARKWKRWESVTGTAWASEKSTTGVGPELRAGGKYAVARGSSARNLEVVVAMPVFSSQGKVIAVLTAVSDKHLVFLLTKGGQDYHVAFSRDIGRVLIDFLGFGE